MKKAVVIGATGLIGKVIVKQLLEDSRYQQVEILVRRKVELQHPNLKISVIEFGSLSQLQFLPNVDFFCALGTTMKTAGSKATFKMVDYAYVLDFAQLALKNQAKSLVIVSSVGAKVNSGNFYLRTKGKMERDVLKLNIKNTHIVRPSMLLGSRSEFRFAERIGQIGMKLIGFLMIGKLARYKAIKDVDVAKAMLYYVNQTELENSIHESEELQMIANRMGS